MQMTELAKFSDTTYTIAILMYSLAALCFAAEFSFAGRRVAFRLARRGQLVAVGGRTSVEGPAESDPGGPPAEPAAVGAAGSRLSKLTIGSTALAALVHASSIAARGLANGRVPLGNMFEYASAITFIAVLSYLVLRLRQPSSHAIGGFLMFVVTVGLVLNGLFLYTESGPLVAALRSRWLSVHVTMISIGFGAFLTSGVAAALYLIRSRVDAGPPRTTRLRSLVERLPPAEALDRASHRLIVFGFPIFTFAVIAGALWAESAWGRFWGWDPKETWAFIAWVVYAAYLHARATAGWKGRAAAWINVVGVAVMIFNLLYVNLVIAGLHSYAGVT